MTQKEQYLYKLFKQLSSQDQHTLLSFAEFLHAQKQPKSLTPQAPLILPRPPNESVVAAIKRLAQSYPMLDKSKMLDETSVLMSEHLVHGRDREQVIDDLEALFQQHYQNLISQE
ncbi:MAG: Crp/Fnr family transcriptional regulator [Pseudomonadota bacterium]|nr:Crp/Fnr family transcriptional regulator [Pseudomonadota bacterium]